MRDGTLLATETPDGLRARTGKRSMDDAFLALIEAGAGDVGPDGGGAGQAGSGPGRGGGGSGP